MATQEMSDFDCSPLLDLLKSYKACLTLRRVSSPEEHWQFPVTVAGRIKDLAKENETKLGKGKAMICGMLEAAMIATQKDKYNVKQIEKESLLELIPCFGG